MSRIGGFVPPDLRMVLPRGPQRPDPGALGPPPPAAEGIPVHEARKGAFEVERWGTFNPANTSYPAAELGFVPMAGEVRVGFPQVVTVTLNRLTPPIIGAPAGNADVIAVVEYAVAGARAQFEVDWINGVQATVLASSIRVQAQGVRADPSVAYNAIVNPPLQISAMLGRGSRASNAPAPTRSFPIVRNAVAPTIFPSGAIPIPAFSRSFYLSGQDDEFDAGGVLLLRNSLAQVVGEYFFNNLVDRVVLIGSTARTWEVQNVVGSGVLSRYTLCWQLGL